MTPQTGFSASAPAPDSDSAESKWAESLDQKIASRAAVVGIVGLGYVGLPLARAFHHAGFPVRGLDVDAEKVRMLNDGQSYLKHLGEGFVQEMAASDRFRATADFAALGDVDVILLCVPTPLGEHREPDLSYVERTAAAVGRTLRRGQLVVLESTTYPGTTRDLVLPRLERSGLTGGADFFVAYSPEREDPGRKNFNTTTIPKLVGGLDAVSGRLAARLYEAALAEVVTVRSAEVAEAAKLLENVYRAVNIALVNEMKVLLTELDIDVWEVINAAATKPFGFEAFYPGPGLGGHCIPIDPFYLTWRAREVGLPTRFIELAGEVNHAMPGYVVQRTAMALNDHAKAIKGAHILVLGLAYKPDVDDVRESPSFAIIEKLQELGGRVAYHDPHVPATHPMRHHDLDMQSVELTPESLAACDCVVVATHHSAYDWQMIADHAPLIVDTRNILRDVGGPRTHIVQA